MRQPHDAIAARACHWPAPLEDATFDDRGVAYRPQWLPVLLATSARPWRHPHPRRRRLQPPPLPAPPAPPCTVELLKRPPAGDKSWPIACRGATLGPYGEELDLSGAHLSHGDFEDATFPQQGARSSWVGRASQTPT